MNLAHRSFATVMPGALRVSPKRGTRDVLAAYSQSPILQAVARKIASGTASQVWRTMANVGGVEQEVVDHPMTRLIEKGAPGLDGLQCRLVTELHMLLVGDAFWVLDRNALGAPVRRWPIPPSWVQETPLPGRPFFRVQPDSGGSAVYDEEDIIWFKDVDPLRPYERGAGVGMALDDELSADEHAAKHVSSSLANRARPDIIVSGTHESPFDDNAVERLKELWPQKYQGSSRAGQPLFSKGPIEVKELTPSFKELELTSLRAYERDIIVSVFGVPPELVGILQNSNRATIESAEFLFTKHVIRPRLIARQATMNDQLAPQYDDGLTVDFDDPVDEDAESRRIYMTTNRWAFSVDEHRAQAGFAPLEDGAGESFPMAFSDMFSDHSPRPIAPAQELSVNGRQAQKPLRKSPDGAVDGIPDDWFALSLTGAYRQTIADFAADALASIGSEIAFDVFDPRVRTWIEETAAERSKLIAGTTRDQLRASLAEGVAAGEATDSLVARIQDIVVDASKSRAEMISRTEIVQASNYATTEAHREAGVEEREWLATQDDRVRDAHVALDGQTKGIDEPFVVDGSSGMYPGGFGVAELDINCRCAVLAKLPNELTGAKRKSAWLKVESGRASHESQLESSLRRDFEALAKKLVKDLEE